MRLAPARPRARRAGEPGAARANRLSSSSATGPTRSAEPTGSASVRARVWVEKSSSRTLIPIVRPPRPCPRAPRTALDQPLEDLARAAPVGDVVVEGRLARLGDHLALLGHRRVVLEARSALQLGRHPRPEPRRPAAGRRRGQLAQRVDPERAQALGGLRPDPRHQPARRAGETLARLLAGQHHEPARLLGVGRDLGHELARPDPDRAAQAGRASICSRDPPHRRVRRGQAVSSR